MPMTTSGHDDMAPHTDLAQHPAILPASTCGNANCLSDYISIINYLTRN